MKKYSLTKLLFFFISISVAFTACKSDDELDINFSPEDSKKYEMSMTSVQNIDMAKMGKATNTIVMAYDLLVKEKDKDNNTIIATSFKKVSLESKGPQGTMSYDSDSKSNSDQETEEAALMSKIFGGMIGKSFTMTVNPSGEVINVTGMSAIFENMLKTSGLDTLPKGRQAVAGFKSQFSDEQFKKNFSESFKILPTTKIKVGDSWEIDNNSSIMGMDINAKNSYTLKNIKDGMAVVDLVSDFNFENIQQEGMPEMKMDGTQTGSLTIDVNTGMTIESNTKQDISITQNMMGQEMPMKISGTVKITSKEVN